MIKRIEIFYQKRHFILNWQEVIVVCVVVYRSN